MHSIYKFILNLWKFKATLQDPYRGKTLYLHSMSNIIPNMSTFKMTLEVSYWRKALSLHSMYKIIFNKQRFKTTLEDPYYREKPYSCTHCRTSFSKGGQVKWHLRTYILLLVRLSDILLKSNPMAFVSEFELWKTFSLHAM